MSDFTSSLKHIITLLYIGTVTLGFLFVFFIFQLFNNGNYAILFWSLILTSYISLYVAGILLGQLYVPSVKNFINKYRLGMFDLSVFVLLVILLLIQVLVLTTQSSTNPANTIVPIIVGFILELILVPLVAKRVWKRLTSRFPSLKQVEQMANQ